MFIRESTTESQPENQFSSMTVFYYIALRSLARTTSLFLHRGYATMMPYARNNNDSSVRWNLHPSSRKRVTHSRLVCSQFYGLLGDSVLVLYLESTLDGGFSCLAFFTLLFFSFSRVSRATMMLCSSSRNRSGWFWGLYRRHAVDKDFRNYFFNSASSADYETWATRL